LLGLLYRHDVLLPDRASLDEAYATGMLRSMQPGRDPGGSVHPVDADAFLAELPRLFDDFPRSEVPLDRSLAHLLEDVEGLSAENNLAMIALAARMLGSGEVYAEAGTFHGRTALAAVLGGGAGTIAIDNFSFEGGERLHLERNLDRFGAAGRVRVLEGDTVEVLERESLPPVGAFYYDADHSAEATSAALQAARPHLAAEALLILDNAEWPAVIEGRDRFLTANPAASLALVIAGGDGGQPWWWDGVAVMIWRAG
jgi:predicted O-methyltransferase YrrM